MSSFFFARHEPTGMSLGSPSRWAFPFSGVSVADHTNTFIEESRERCTTRHMSEELIQSGQTWRDLKRRGLFTISRVRSGLVLGRLSGKACEMSTETLLACYSLVESSSTRKSP